MHSCSFVDLHASVSVAAASADTMKSKAGAAACKNSIHFVEEGKEPHT